MDNPDFKVFVRCVTYNHSSYIENTLNGFCIQQTSFPFVCTIIDDASTDGEQERIKHFLAEYFDLDDIGTVQSEETEDYIYTYAQHKNNRNCFFSVYYLKYNHYRIKKAKNYYNSKFNSPLYLAICEGDDYWTDPLKLQKQASFLDTHPDYSFCHTGFTYFFEDKNELQESDSDNQNILSIIRNKEDIRFAILDNNRYRIQTATVMVRYQSYLHALEILKPYKGKYLMGDTQLWIVLLSLGKIFFLPESTGMYRIHGGSSSRQVDKKAKARFNLSSSEMRITMSEYCHLETWQIKKFYHQYYTMLCKYYLFDKEYQTFIEMKYCNVGQRIMLFFCKSPITNKILKKIYDYKNR